MSERERRYTRGSRRSHWVPSYLGMLSRSALCGLTVDSALWEWFGSGNQDEIDRANAMPLCARCAMVAARRRYHEQDEPPAPADSALGAIPDRLLTTAAVGALLGINPASVRRWAWEHGLRPQDQLRLGRSTITHWSERAILGAALNNPPRPRRPRKLTPPR